MNWFNFIKELVSPITDLIGNMHTSDEERMQAQAKLDKIAITMQAQVLDAEAKDLEARKEIILAEARGSWMQRNWRPSLMFVFMAMLLNNFVIQTYFKSIEYIEFPAAAWGLLTVSVGGYIGAREYGKKRKLDALKKKEAEA